MQIYWACQVHQIMPAVLLQKQNASRLYDNIAD
jgi:hypothetical protein